MIMKKQVYVRKIYNSKYRTGDSRSNELYGNEIGLKGMEKYYTLYFLHII